MINSVIWSTNNRNDGYGLDDFSTVKAVPEPGSMMLLGFSLIGIGVAGRKKFQNR